MLSIVYNNIHQETSCTPAWGMACVVQGTDKTILFDTGGNGNILLSNMEAMGISPEDIDIVEISHNHGDHTGGLSLFLEKNPSVTVYLPASFPRLFVHHVESYGASVVRITTHRQILPGVYSTGELGNSIKEQALIVRSRRGSILITGCSHPGIDLIARAATDIIQEDLYLITGGFHLGGASEREIGDIIATLKELNVEKIAPSHCTGDRAIRLFKEAWESNFIEAGCGARLTFGE